MIRGLDFYNENIMGHGIFWALIPIFLVLVVAVMALKAYTLWHSAKRGELVWFIVIFIFNTAGILELVYIIFVLKKFHSKDKIEAPKVDNIPPSPTA